MLVEMEKNMTVMVICRTLSKIHILRNLQSQMRIMMMTKLQGLV